MKFVLLAGFLCVLIVAAAVGYLLLRLLRSGANRQRVLTRGAPTVCWVIGADMDLCNPGTSDGGAIALISPDERTADDREFMLGFIDLIYHSDKWPTDDTAEDVAIAYGLVSGINHTPWAWDRLPEGATGGREIFVVNVQVARADLPTGRIRPSLGYRLPCAVIWDEPGSLIYSRPEDNGK